MTAGSNPLLADHWLGLVKFETTPAAMRQEAAVNAQPECFGRAEHSEVQAGEECEEAFPAPRKVASFISSVSRSARADHRANGCVPQLTSDLRSLSAPYPLADRPSRKTGVRW